jgi:peptidoglycan hydrolase CwlO-like protein
MASQIRALEYDISKALGQIDDLQRDCDHRSKDIAGKENQLAEVEQDVSKLKS